MVAADAAASASAARDVTKRSTEKIVRLGVAHVPEGRGTFAPLTVEENLRLGAYSRRDKGRPMRSAPSSSSRAWRSAARSSAGTLSGGEQQMLAIARALMLRPKLMLLDEPSLGLAPKLVRELFKTLRRIKEDEGTAMLIVEQNANLVLEFADAAHVLETGRVVLSGTADGGRRRRDDAQGLPGVLTVERFIETVIDGIATGSIYGALALALVLIYRSTGIVNFAQGEMAMFSTFVAWGLVEAGLPVGARACWSRSCSRLLGGMLIERALIRPVEGSQELTLVTVTLGLFILVNGLARWIWGSSNRGFPSLFGDGNVTVGGVCDQPRVARPGRRAARRRRDAVAGLPAHQARAGDARRRGQPRDVEPARRHPGRADADDRLGPGRGVRRAGRRARRAAAVPGPEPDGPA